MKTTLLIDDGVMQRLKQEAVRRRTTISSLVESALRRFLRDRRAATELPELPSFDGGGCQVDIADRDLLYQTMEGR